MRLPRTLWFMPVLLSCTLQIAFASCGEDQKEGVGAAGQPPKVAVGQPPKNSRTVFLSVFLTNSGFVRDTEVISGPQALRRPAIGAVRQRRYRNLGTPVTNSVRNLTLAVTFPKRKGAPPKIQPWLAGVVGGVPGCVVGGRLVAVVPPPFLQPSWLTSSQPVMPVLAPDTVKVRVINGKNLQPIPKQRVFVQLLYEKPTKISPSMLIETNANGEAEFSIPEPLPEHLDVRLALTSSHWHCTCSLMTDTEKVFNTGVLKVLASKVPNASNAPVNVEPKQIVFVARPFTFFEKMLHPLVKQ